MRVASREVPTIASCACAVEALCSSTAAAMAVCASTTPWMTCWTLPSAAAAASTSPRTVSTTRRIRSVASHGHASPAEVVGVVPVGRVEQRPSERVQARDVRRAGTAQLPGGGDEDVGLVLASPGKIQPPAPRGLVEGGAEHLGVETDVRQHAEAACDVAQVLVDLRLRGEPPRPVGLRRERQRVQVGGHVAGGAGIGVLPPHSPDVAALLEEHDVLDAGLEQAHDRGEPPEAGADDRDAGHRGALRSTRRAVAGASPVTADRDG
jgi:hypothetical protein